MHRHFEKFLNLEDRHPSTAGGNSQLEETDDVEFEDGDKKEGETKDSWS